MMNELLTAEDIVDRAELAQRRFRNNLFWLGIFLSFLVITLYEPVHAWLHGHLELLLGFALGAWLELFAVAGWPWLRDRVRWLRWFSWQ